MYVKSEHITSRGWIQIKILLLLLPACVCSKGDKIDIILVVLAGHVGVANHLNGAQWKSIKDKSVFANCVKKKQQKKQC